MESDLRHGTGTSGTTPSFDEDWTVLTARPVVPLDELKTKTARHPSLKLVALFVLALVLGAWTALMTISLRVATNQSVESDGVPEQLIIAEAAPTPIELPKTFEKSEVEAEGVLPKKVPVTLTLKPKTSQVPSKQSATDPNVDSLTHRSSREVEVQESQPPVNRFEERRLRRVFRRQRRERAAQRSGDLMRIDEIFEGRRP